ncbi:MAG: hypothetical protein P8Z49_06120 [Acidobacteriota bacterium]|jgi:hypothetical protein
MPERPVAAKIGIAAALILWVAVYEPLVIYGLATEGPGGYFSIIVMVEWLAGPVLLMILTAWAGKKRGRVQVALWRLGMGLLALLALIFAGGALVARDASPGLLVPSASLAIFVVSEAAARSSLAHPDAKAAGPCREP